MPPAIEPDLLETAARLALSSRHPLAAAVAREARDRDAVSTGAIEEPGQGVRAMIDGSEARLGSAAFCGIADRMRDADRARHLARSLSRMAAAAPSSRSARRCGPMRVAVVQALAALGSTLRILSGDRADSGRADRGGARHRATGTAASSRPTRSPRIDALKARGPPRADGRRRPQRRAGAGRRACLAVADQRRRSGAGAGRRGVPRRAARSRCCDAVDDRAPRAPR